jgi:hypothetical protein
MKQSNRGDGGLDENWGRIEYGCIMFLLYLYSL